MTDFRRVARLIDEHCVVELDGLLRSDSAPPSAQLYRLDLAKQAYAHASATKNVPMVGAIFRSTHDLARLIPWDEFRDAVVGCLTAENAADIVTDWFKIPRLFRFIHPGTNAGVGDCCLGTVMANGWVLAVIEISEKCSHALYLPHLGRTCLRYFQLSGEDNKDKFRSVIRAVTRRDLAQTSRPLRRARPFRFLISDQSLSDEVVDGACALLLGDVPPSRLTGLAVALIRTCPALDSPRGASLLARIAPLIKADSRRRAYDRKVFDRLIKWGRSFLAVAIITDSAALAALARGAPRLPVVCVKSDDVKSDGAKSDDVKSDDVKSDDVKSDGVKKHRLPVQAAPLELSACRAVVASAFHHSLFDEEIVTSDECFEIGSDECFDLTHPNPWSPLRELVRVTKTVDLRYISRDLIMNFINSSTWDRRHLASNFDKLVNPEDHLIAPLSFTLENEEAECWPHLHVADLLIRISELFRPLGVKVVLSDYQCALRSAKYRLLCLVVAAWLKRLGLRSVSVRCVARDMIAGWL